MWHNGRSIVPEAPEVAVALPCQWINCHYVLPTEESLLRHIYEEHATRSQSWLMQDPACKQLYFCQWDNCEVVVTERDHFLSHLRVHVDVWPYVCTSCSRSFQQPQDLKRHLTTLFHSQKMTEQAKKESSMHSNSECSNDSHHAAEVLVHLAKNQRMDEGLSDETLNNEPNYQFDLRSSSSDSSLSASYSDTEFSPLSDTFSDTLKSATQDSPPVGVQNCGAFPHPQSSLDIDTVQIAELMGTSADNYGQKTQEAFFGGRADLRSVDTQDYGEGELRSYSHLYSELCSPLVQVPHWMQ